MRRATGYSAGATNMQAVVARGLVAVPSYAISNSCESSRTKFPGFELRVGDGDSDWRKPDGWRRLAAHESAEQQSSSSSSVWSLHRAESLLPPRVWAAWVLSQSLCG